MAPPHNLALACVTVVVAVFCTQRVYSTRPSSTSADASPLDKDANFMRWIRERGVNTSRIELHRYKKRGRGLRATEDFQPGDLFARIDSSLVIDKDVARSTLLRRFGRKNRDDLSTVDDSISSLTSFLDSLDGCDLVSLFLVEERRHLKNSPWKAYLDILPEKPNIPLFANVSRIVQVLRHSKSVYRTLEEKFRVFETKVRLLGPAYASLFGGTAKDFEEEFRWAYSQLISRAWRVSDSAADVEIGRAGRESQCYMLPLIDLLNHDERESGDPVALSPSVSSPDSNKKFDVGVVGSFPVHRGAQLFQNYRPKLRCNVEILWNYGFVEIHNPDYDCCFFDVDLGVTLDAAKRHRKMELLRRLGIDKASESFVVRTSSISRIDSNKGDGAKDGEEPFSSMMHRLWCALRISDATADELVSLLEEEKEGKLRSTPFDRLSIVARALPTQSVLNELRQLRRLTDAFDQLLDGHTASIYRDRLDGDRRDHRSMPRTVSGPPSELVGEVLRGERRALLAFTEHLNGRWWDLTWKKFVPSFLPYVIALNGIAVVVYFRKRVMSFWRVDAPSSGASSLKKHKKRWAQRR